MVRVSFSTITPGGSVIVLTFVNEANPVYHGFDFDGVVDGPSGTYVTDYNTFVNTVFPSFDYFAAI